ncbi:GEM-like protein 4 [Canna indica]|uniref:GEM-like protein 4 n=1 Tax=Canna indica TaxID=4628 RepID=A0AAQ3L0G0_9LILI|nr:GEM-like protein 4 [Canna indica]
MKTTNHDQAVGLPVGPIRYATEMAGRSAAVSELNRLCLHSTSYETSQYKQKMDSPVAWISKFSKKADSYVKGIRDHVSLGTKISEIVKGKLSLGAKILKAGGVERVFRQNFSVEKGEKLLQAFQCYLSTTAGPIAGLLFISTNKIAFRSNQSIRITSSRGNLAKVPYKVLIPLKRVKRTSLCENSRNPNQKYIQIVTVDEFDFWFMGFLSYQRSLKYLRRAISKSQVDVLH